MVALGAHVKGTAQLPATAARPAVVSAAAVSGAAALLQRALAGVVLAVLHHEVEHAAGIAPVGSHVGVPDGEVVRVSAGGVAAIRPVAVVPHAVDLHLHHATGVADVRVAVAAAARGGAAAGGVPLAEPALGLLGLDHIHPVLAVASPADLDVGDRLDGSALLVDRADPRLDVLQPLLLVERSTDEERTLGEQFLVFVMMKMKRARKQ